MATGRLRRIVPSFRKPPDKDTQHFVRSGLVRILRALKVGKIDSWRDNLSNQKGHIGAGVGGGARECDPTDESGCWWGLITPA